MQSLSPLQQKILEVFSKIDKICEENNLTYYAIGGTCLGAARHEGFIPWDDDLDIAMPFDDLQKLLKIVKRQHPDELGVHAQESNAFIFKIFDIHTTQVSETDFNLKDYTGVFVDIMPLFSIPNTNVSRWLFWQKIRYLMRLNNISEKPSDRTGLKRVVYYFTQAISRDFLVNKYRDELNKRSFYNDSFTHTGRTWGAGKNRSRSAFIAYDKQMLQNGIRLKFENITINCPVNYNDYLVNTFGKDYMTLPPKDKQVTAHTRILDLGLSYKYYVAKAQGKRIGYTAGCYDLFHIGHMNLLRRAKKECDYLIVGVNADKAMYSYKKKYPVIPEAERMEILAGLKCVDEAVLVTDTDKYHAYEKYKFDVIFVGDDHKNEPKWVDLEKKLAKKGSKVHYFEYTKHISSSKLRETLKK